MWWGLLAYVPTSVQRNTVFSLETLYIKSSKDSTKLPNLDYPARDRNEFPILNAFTRITFPLSRKPLGEYLFSAYVILWEMSSFEMKRSIGIFSREAIGCRVSQPGLDWCWQLLSSPGVPDSDYASLEANASALLV